MSELNLNAVPQECRGQRLFISGYFGDRLRAGEQPTYGYPPNHLPDGPAAVEVVASFICALKSDK